MALLPLGDRAVQPIDFAPTEPTPMPEEHAMHVQTALFDGFDPPDAVARHEPAAWPRRTR
ncbi:hypothetical protein [Actinomadura rubteroloni]|uniref:hypothetical protein n=1 Tax=Actinomadura rubteroloni TaxID=1926885 RepID=UPI000CD9CFBA|nr:hypothetical protein [Actinomadura rubteroloni]